LVREVADGGDEPIATGIRSRSFEDRWSVASCRSSAQRAREETRVTDIDVEAAPAPAPRPAKAGRGNPITALRRRTRETVSEMRKVLWPSRQEMTTYTLVVIVFVVFMVSVVWALDYGFAKVVLGVFG
jgi:preprotein translocase subunit SecE